MSKSSLWARVRIEKGQGLMPDFLLAVLVYNVNDSNDIYFQIILMTILKKTKCCSKERLKWYGFIYNEI